MAVQDAIAGDELAVKIESRLGGGRQGTVPERRRVRRALSRELRPVPAPDVLRALQALRSDPAIPPWLLFELVHFHPGVMRILDIGMVESLGEGISAWHEVDPFACYVSGPAWREGNIEEADILRWSASADRWWRRTALVSTVALNSKARGGRGDFDRTILICDALKSDRDDMVVKALSWALRELAVRRPEEVRQYLTDSEADLPKRVLREVGNKLTTGLKNPRRSIAPRPG